VNSTAIIIGIAVIVTGAGLVTAGMLIDRPGGRHTTRHAVRLPRWPAAGARRAARACSQFPAQARRVASWPVAHRRAVAIFTARMAAHEPLGEDERPGRTAVALRMQAVLLAGIAQAVRERLAADHLRPGQFEDWKTGEFAAIGKGWMA
jgi:hypothetical protein